jgi:hypothetical protein
MPSICGPFEFLPLPDCAQAGASKAQTANIPLSKRKIVIFTVVVSPSGELMILCEYVTRRLLTFFLPLGVEALFERSLSSTLSIYEAGAGAQRKIAPEPGEAREIHEL